MYTHFFGFSEEPFPDSPDPRFLFAVPDHQRTLGCLIQAIEGRGEWASLIGEPGSGKTILIHHLMESLKEKPAVKTVFIFQTRISFEDLLGEVLSELNLPLVSPTGAPIAEHFNLCIAQILPPGKTLVVFLDEAQNFSIEVLGKISNFFSNELQRPERIHIIFSGQPLLDEKLQAKPLQPLAQRIRFRCSLKPFTELESQRYLDHRLHLAGGNPDIITPDALSLIIRYGEGIPRKINILCDNAFRIAHQFSEANISAEIVRKALGEMYPQADQPALSGKPAKRQALLKKGLYPLAAMIVLGLAIFFAKEYSQGKNESEKSKEDVRLSKIEKEESPLAPQRAEERAAEKMEAGSMAPANQILPQPTPEPPPPVLPPLKKLGIAQRVKKVIRVKKGDTLSNFCLEHYGFANLTLLDHIMALNPELTNPSRIQPGQRIILPHISEESLAQVLPDGRVQVFLGTFRHPDLAKTFRKEAMLSGEEIKITPLKIDGGETWYRFSTGAFANKDEALKMIRLLKEKRILPSLSNYGNHR